MAGPILAMKSLSPHEDFWGGVLAGDFFLACAAVILAGVLALGLVLRAMLRLSPGWRLRPFLGHDVGATATIEFALLLPILLFVILILAQTTLLMGGNLFVHYAAFAATRSAIVQIPSQTADEEANVYGGSTGAVKQQAIWRSAVHALVPVSGRDGTSSPTIPTTAVTQAWRDFFGAYGAAEPPWVENLLVGRLGYASANTDVRVGVSEAQAGGDVEVLWEPGSYEPRDAITVLVSHRLNLPVPYVSRIVADGTPAGGAGRCLTITARYTMTNEGVRQDLPPPTPLPRIPQ